MRMYYAQDDLNLRILRVFEGTFSLDAAHKMFMKLGISFLINSVTNIIIKQ